MLYVIFTSIFIKDQCHSILHLSKQIFSITCSTLQHSTNDKSFKINLYYYHSDNNTLLSSTATHGNKNMLLNMKIVLCWFKEYNSEELYSL